MNRSIKIADRFPPLRGRLNIVVKKWDPTEQIEKVIRDETIPNKILNTARVNMARLCTLSELADVEQRRVKYLWVGTGGHTPGDVYDPIEPSAADQWLEEPIPAETGYPLAVAHFWPQPDIAEFVATLSRDQLNVNPISPGFYLITEALLSGEGDGVGAYVWARDTFMAIPKGDDISITFNWRFLF